MDFFDVIRERRSVRRFERRPVEEEKLKMVLKAAYAAPSAGNLQAYELFAVNNPAALARLVELLPGMKFFAEVPLVLVFCADPDRSAVRYKERGRTLYAVQDATIACTQAMLAITALGMATVWVGAFPEESVSAALGLPAGLRPVALLPVGYAAESPAPRNRREWNSMVHTVS